MDPDTALATVRQGVAWLEHELDHTDRTDVPEDVAHVIHELVNSFSGLDGWLERGNSLPHAWDINRLGI